MYISFLKENIISSIYIPQHRMSSYLHQLRENQNVKSNIFDP